MSVTPDTLSFVDYPTSIQHVGKGDIILMDGEWQRVVEAHGALEYARLEDGVVIHDWDLPIPRIPGPVLEALSRSCDPYRTPT